MGEVLSIRIISWNVNGLSASIRKGLIKHLSVFGADVICLQEVRSDVPLNLPGYQQFWNLAARKGYSGTLLLTKKLPERVMNGIGDERFDVEGRVITADFGGFYLINAYIPSYNTNSQDWRLAYRIEFDHAFRTYVESLQKPVVIAGDFNVAHKHNDIYPENQKLNQASPVFSSDERDDFDRLLKIGLTDAFRYLYPFQTGIYSWWGPKNQNRSENRGSRLDYFLVSDSLAPRVKAVEYYPKIYCSDHCPLSLWLTERESTRTITYAEAAQQWQSIDWDVAERELSELQRDLALAAKQRDHAEIRRLQDKLVNSAHIKALAVRAVSSKNSAAGVDGIRLTTDALRMKAVLAMDAHNYVPQPYRDYNLNERGKDRRLLIAAARDKAMLMLYSYALDPVAEEFADKKSFAGRKGRSALDAFVFLQRAFSGEHGALYAVIIDVAAYYDGIIHKTLLNVIPMDTDILRKFLQAGAIKTGELFPTDKGISMASSLSPILGNMLLDGLQSFIYDKLYPDGGVDYLNGNMIRFCDDIVITAKSEESAVDIMSAAAEFLAIRGLSMNPEKSHIVSINQGFNFLSWHFKKKDGMLITQPSVGAINNIEHELKTLILTRKLSQREMILKINQKLSGWAFYHRVTDAYEAFRHIDVVVETLLTDLLQGKYYRWGAEAIKKHFWIMEDKHPVFALPEDPSIRIIRLASVPTVQHEPVRLGFNPYLDRDYYSALQHRRHEQKATGKYKVVWQRQGGKCAYCGYDMLRDQEVQVVEKEIGRGETPKNLQYIHKLCAYDIFSNADNDRVEYLDTLSILRHLSDTHPVDRSPYYELQQFFHLSSKSLISLSFEDIEEIIGIRLGYDAYCFKAFWYDEQPGRDSYLWKAENYPSQFIIEPEREYCISDCWLTQGYEIKVLDLSARRITFRQTDKHLSAIVVPQELLINKVPDKIADRVNRLLLAAKKECGF